MTSVPLESEPSSRTYGPGTIISGKYELVRPLGEGRTGTMWVARNIALQADVALKFLRADLTDEDASERLLKEARIAARLDHSAIVRVFDFGQTSQGHPFIVMDLVEGETLAALLSARGRLAPVKAVQIVLPVLDALATAHAFGIVHGDLRPENILLAREAGRTQPKIVDFTRQGTTVGSRYVAPEQTRTSSTIDARADVWAMCVVLYESIAGRPAFQGENSDALVRAIVEDDPVPVTGVEVGDFELWMILERGLQKDPAARWLSALELGTALAEWLMRNNVDVDIAGGRLGAWIQPDSSRRRDLLSAPPPALPAPNSGKRTPGPAALPRSVSGSQPMVATVISRKRSQPFRALATFVATIAVLILGATVAITFVTRRHASTIGSSPEPSLETTAPAGLEPPPATTSAPPLATASAAVPVEAPDPTNADRSPKPKPTARETSVPKKTKASAKGSSPSDLKDPY